MSWINDFCEDSYVDERRRAEGILSIHAPCTPPCPRARAAAAYLDSTTPPATTPIGDLR